MSKTTYSDLLKDPRWQKKRLEILNRDNWTCQECGDTEETLHVHHKSYKGSDPWDTPDSDLITYCQSCHECFEDALKTGFKVHAIVNNGVLFNGKQIAVVYDRPSTDERCVMVFENNLTGVCLLTKDVINTLHTLVNNTDNDGK